ncbi:uncharacterized protein LOC142340126 [Convolutriloba macropyga]|uniref:uncharacterized protein LOC142340126 n=1 Tax=Convolutriloba macropyga TaxID=536237 RepID=UPI003F5227E5
MLGASILDSFTFHITGETVIANDRNKYFQSKSFPSADGDFNLDFGDYMRDDGVKITDKQFVANQFNQTGFSKMGLDSSGRLTLRGVDLETKNVKAFHVSVKGGNSLIFTDSGILMVTSEKNGGGDILYKSRDVASHHCSRTVDGVARDAVKFIGRPAHTIDECAAGKIPSDISEATVNVLTNATVGGMDAIGWWWIADWVKNICPIVADGAEIAGEVQSTKGGVTTYFTCIFETPCIYGTLTRTKVVKADLRNFCDQRGEKRSLYECSHAALQESPKATHAYLTSSGMCYSCAVALKGDTIILYNGTTNDSVCILKG